MRNRDSRDYLKDIFNSLNDIGSFVENMSFDSFHQDKKTIYAVLRCIDVIGDASRMVPRSIRDKYPAVPWLQMSAMMEKMVHDYFEVDYNILWQTVKEDVPSLKLFLQGLEKELC